MQSVYIETTIPSFYHESRTTSRAIAWRDATRAWWKQNAKAFDCVTSQVVVEELRLAPKEKSAKCLALLAPIRHLKPTERIAEVIAYYIEHKLVPADSPADAAHLAFASVHSIDFLLTWNCQHLANANKAKHIAVINNRLGLASPIITTPLTLFTP